MNNIYKIFISNVCIITIISTAVLFAGPDQRRGIVTAIGSLFCGNTYQRQESVIDFLAQLHATDDKAFHQLFDYVVNKKGNLDLKLADVLMKKNLINKTDAPSEKPEFLISESLTKTFNFLKAIIDDYNKETKINCCESCCGGCFIPWCRENGTKILQFTLTNSIALITAMATKQQVRSPSLSATDRSGIVPVEPLDIEIVLKQLSGDIID